MRTVSAIVAFYILYILFLGLCCLLFPKTNKDIPDTFWLWVCLDSLLDRLMRTNWKSASFLFILFLILCIDFITWHIQTLSSSHFLSRQSCDSHSFLIPVLVLNLTFVSQLTGVSSDSRERRLLHRRDSFVMRCIKREKCKKK